MRFLSAWMAIPVVFFEALWNIDFFFRLATGKPFIGLSAYMFDQKIPLFIAGYPASHRPAAATSLDPPPTRLR